MKAIETIYNGYRFRSRLEARWAVFFDTLGIEYQYEKEGYELGDGIRYLPDFWLPEQDCFVEIKGEKPTEEEKKKARFLSSMSRKRVFIFFGDVWIPMAQAEDSALGFNPYLSRNLGRNYWCECPMCKKLDIVHFGECSNLLCECHRNFKRYFNAMKIDISGMSRQEQERLQFYTNYDSPRLIAAYAAARSARFEYGR
jgi:hypothetical protein